MARKPNPAPTTRRRRRARPSRRIAAIGLLGTGLYATLCHRAPRRRRRAGAGGRGVTRCHADPDARAARGHANADPDARAARGHANADPDARAARAPRRRRPRRPSRPPRYRHPRRRHPRRLPRRRAPRRPPARRARAVAPSPRLRASGPPRPTRMRASDRTSRRKRRPNAKAGEGKHRRNPAPARRKHAPGRPADRPTGTDGAPVPAADRGAVAGPVGAPLAGPLTPIGIPGFFIDEFRIPPFLLPIYQAAGMQYGVRWEVLAAINEIETDYGRNLNVSSAGAIGLDAVHARHVGARTASTPTATAARTRTTRSTRSSPPRAICAPPAPTATSAERSSPTTTRDWYVDSVLMRARVDRRPAERSRGLAHRARAGPLPGRAPRRSDAATDARARRRDRRARRRARDRGQRRPDRPDRPVTAARPHVQLERRLRQHLHLRRPRQIVGARPDGGSGLVARHPYSVADGRAGTGSSTRPACPSRSSSGCSRTRRARRRRPSRARRPPVADRLRPARTTGRCR